MFDMLESNIINKLSGFDSELVCSNRSWRKLSQMEGEVGCVAPQAWCPLDILTYVDIHGRMV